MFQQKDRLCEENSFFFFPFLSPPVRLLVRSLNDSPEYIFIQRHYRRQTELHYLQLFIKFFEFQEDVVSSKHLEKEKKNLLTKTFLWWGFFSSFFLETKRKHPIREQQREVKQLNMRHDSECHKTKRQRKKCLKYTSYTKIYHFITPGVRTHAVTLTPRICFLKEGFSLS